MVIAGIATEGDYRFRISMDASDTDKRLRQRAKFLVPNTNNNFNFDEYSQDELRNSTDFTVNEQLSTITDGTQYENDITNQYNYLEEFYPFRWKKVYTVKQYIGRMLGGLICKNCDTLCNNQGDFNEDAPNPKFRCCGWFDLFGNTFCGNGNQPANQYNQILRNTPLDEDEGEGKNNLYMGNCSTKEIYQDNPGYTFGDSSGGPCPTGGGEWCGDAPTNDITGAIEGSGVDKPCGAGTITFNNVGAGSPEFNCCPFCCIKIPLIPLKCDEEGIDDSVTILSSPFGSTDCNRKYAKPGGCVNCGGYQTQVIKDWVACLLEPVAVFLKMVKFDFYNDWVGGSLYFPLIKRKYKLKKRGRKFGQIKKDKFCDFECYDKDREGDFQGDDTYQQWRIKVKDVIGTNPSITVDGCTAKVKGKRVTNWYGTVDNDDQIYNLNLAVKELTFGGTDANSNDCNIKFATWDDFTTTFTSASIDYEDQSKEVATEHGKPEYIETDDGFGNSTWKNIGGHGHHKNSCDNTNMVERKEFFKTTLDCLGPVEEAPPGSAIIQGLITNYSNLPCQDPTTDPTLEPYEQWQECLNTQNLNSTTLSGKLTFKKPTGFCIAGCDADCGSNGVAPCKKTTIDTISNYNGETIRHGLISWYNEEIYYTPRIKEVDPRFNPNEYKGNLLMPTTILELGSSVYCDIDDVPFIMDQLPPTTFAASFEDMKYKLGDSNPFTINQTFATDNNLPNSLIGESAEIQPITSYDDKKDSSLNLRAYAEFSCVSVVCANTSAAVNQSQLGVEIIDKNDIGIEIGNCFVRFEHDTDLREYFCKRFNGYKRRNNNTLSFHHTRPGSIEFDNTYGSYPEITLTQGYNLFYTTPEGETILSEYNDGDSFIPGDGCGYKPKDNDNPLNKTDYFYGLAPGQTSGFINYPNYDTVDGAAGTIIFGQSAQGADGTDEIFSAITNGTGFEDDGNNGSVDVKGVRHNRSQTPYFLYFGLVPGKTALNKVVGKFFGDKINAVTLEGIGASPDDVSQNINNKNNLKNDEENPFTTFRTCLGDTLIDTSTVGVPPSSYLVPNTLTPPYPEVSNLPVVCGCCSPYAPMYIGDLEINNTIIPINLFINGGTLPTGNTGWRIRLLYAGTNNYVPSSDVTLSDTNGNTYVQIQGYSFVTQESTSIEITFSNSGSYRVQLELLTCDAQSDAYVTISV